LEIIDPIEERTKLVSGELFERRGLVCMLVRVDPDNLKLVCLKSGNRYYDQNFVYIEDLKEKGWYKSSKVITIM
jgi:hypothetical protein